ncbi:MAG: hypothetical protein F4Y75_07425 [Acidimicrobiia bacterium]|nr:hypothetical protein [bacterium]MXX64772.1 hypothetical protein [Acidimicrobiia bacterium]MCY3579765.1 hypothetical protein [bacterium]MCY3652276.1 hypothetical protein [bacterium]MDE0643106.1 hypothetical protein [bacterium]
MGEHTTESVEALLRSQGLTGPEFDPARIAEALSGWEEAGRELDRLLTEHEGEARSLNPTVFSAEWETGR